jgi:vitamin K-dependent gamma-carboxylase
MTATERGRPTLAPVSRRPRAWARLSSRLAAPVDGASVAVFRIAFGALMVLAVVRFAARGWIHEYYLAPTHFFTYAGLGWITPWPGAGMYVHFAAMGAAAALLLVGLWTRASALLFAALFAYAHLCDKTNYLNHYYLVIVVALLLAALPAGDVVSVDGWRRARRAGLPMTRTVPAWAVWTLRGQLAIVYVFGGVAKLQPDWLVHAQPLEAWLAGHAELAVVGPLLDQPWAPHVASWLAAGFDLTIAGWLLWPRSRPLAYVAVVAFHLATVRLFHLGLFPWLMMALTPIFFAPDWPRRLWARLARRSVAQPPDAPPRPPGRGLGALLVVHAALQVAIPLRFLAYPGYHLWTEEGFRFAWKVMVMEKSGVADFLVRDPDTGREWRVAATDHWTRYQASMMATQPDMILEAAHVIAAEQRRRGVARPEVRADVMVSLNGRPAARLIDPAVDLAAERFALTPHRWILPAPSSDPP